MEKEEAMAAIKAYFLSGGKLTVLSAIYKFGTTELRKIISRLRNDKSEPMNIIDRYIITGKKRHKEYYMPLDKAQ